MTTLEDHRSTQAIDAATTVGIVALTVADLDRSIDYYTRSIGLALVERTGPEAVLGVAGKPLLLLTEQEGALPWMVDAATGLYHFAILVPTRADLGRWFRHFITTENPPPGQGDHIVSEALYLRDPDGHGIEMYWDRPRAGWKWIDGKVQMGSGAVDVRSMVAEANQAGLPWTGLPSGTIVGHIHLQVGDIAAAETFYHGVLGFDVVAAMPTALFVSAGGYHHHLGMNVWHSRNAAPAPADTATLGFYTIALPTDEARSAVVSRLALAGIAFSDGAGTTVLRDPWQNVIVLHTGPVADARNVTAVAAATSGRTV